jgi:hypothetical protein
VTENVTVDGAADAVATSGVIATDGAAPLASANVLPIGP